MGLGRQRQTTLNPTTTKQKDSYVTRPETSVALYSTASQDDRAALSRDPLQLLVPLTNQTV